MLGQPRAQYTTARPIAIQFHRHGYIEDLITEGIFDSKGILVIGVLGLFFDLLFMDSVQPVTVRRPVDWCRNELNVCTVTKAGFLK